MLYLLSCGDAHICRSKPVANGGIRLHVGYVKVREIQMCMAAAYKEQSRFSSSQWFYSNIYKLLIRQSLLQL